MVRRFSYLGTSLLGCGVAAWASKATFIIDASGEELKVAVSCIEMQFVRSSATGAQMPLKVGERYTVVLTRKKPTPDMASPFLLNKKPWYLSSAWQQARSGPSNPVETRRQVSKLAFPEVDAPPSAASKPLVYGLTTVQTAPRSGCTGTWASDLPNSQITFAPVTV